MSKADETIVELLKSLVCYSVEELESMRQLYLKDIEDVDNSDMLEVLQHCGNKCFDLVIRIKRKELEGEYAENDSCTS